MPVGQTEAARAIGLRFSQVLTLIVLPQAFRSVMGPLANVLIALTRNTALGGVLLGFSELLASVRPLSANYGANTIASFTVVAVVFVVLNFALTSFASWLEGRLRRGTRSTGAVVGADAVEELATPGKHVSHDDLGGGAAPPST